MATSNLIQKLDILDGAGATLPPGVSNRRQVETFNAAGTIAAGDIVMWNVTAGATAGDSGALASVVKSALRALGQPLACGVALESAAAGDTVNVVISGFATVNCAANTGTIVLGDPLVASVVTAGEAEVNVAANTARPFGVALEAADATVANFVNICVYPQF